MCSIGSCVGLAYVWRPDGAPVSADYLDEGRWQVNVGGTLVDATVSLKAPYDPASERIRL